MRYFQSGPQADFSGSPLSGTVSLEVTFSNNSSNASSYHWDFGDGATSSEVNPVHTYSQSGVYTVTLLAGDGVVTDTLTRANYISANAPPPPADIGDYAVFGLNSLWLRQGSDLHSGHVGAQIASPGPVLDSGVEVSIGQSVTFHDPASLIVGDSVKLKLGSAVFDLYANDLDPASNAGYGQHFTSLSLPVVNNVPSLPPINPGSTNITLNQNETLTLAAGAYGEILLKKNAILTLTGGLYHLNNLNIGDNVQVLITAPTEVRIANRLEPGSSATLGPAVGSGLDATDLVLFIAGINGSSGALGGTPKAAAIGLNNVVTATIFAPNGTLWLKQGTTARGAFIAKDVEIGEQVQVHLENAFAGGYQSPSPVVAGFTGSPLSGASPLDVAFTNTSSGASSYLWNFGDGATSAATNPVHTYTAAGVYTVTLSASDGVVTNTLARSGYITVTAPVVPQADFSGAPLSGTAPLTVTFTNSSTNASTYLWDFGDGTPGSSEANPVHAYAAAGVYTVTLLASDGTVTDTLLRPEYITVSAAAVPQADFSGTPLSGTAPLTVTFTNSSTNASIFIWNFGDGTPSILNSQFSITHPYTQAGVYTVTLSASNGTVTDTLVRPAYINMVAPAIPQADFSGAPLGGTAPLTVTFTNSSTNASIFVWNFGDSPSSFIIPNSSFTHTYTQAGVYTVTLQAGDGLVTDTLTRADYINVAEPVVADFSAFPRSGPIPLIVQFLGNSTNATAYLWDFGDGLTATVASPVHTYTVAGVYTVTLTAGNGVNTNTLTKTDYITASEPLVVDFAAFPLNGSLPLIVQFLDNSTGANSYLWDFGDGGASLLPSPVHTYTTAGVYTVTLTAGNSLISKTLTKTNYITATGAPIVISPTGVLWWNDRYFYRQPLTFTVNSPLLYTPGVTQVLAVSLDTATLLANNQLLPDGKDLRVVYLDSAGVWHDLPRQLIGFGAADTSIQFPLQNTITETSASYYLYYGHPNPNHPANLYAEMNTGPGVTINGSGTITLSVSFTATTYAGLAPLDVAFTASVSPTNVIAGYSWNFGDGGSATEANPGHTYTAPGLYDVTLTATTNEGMQVTYNWPQAIEVAGIDAGGQTTVVVGAQETPVVSALISAAAAEPQIMVSANGRLRATFPPGAITEDIVVTHTPHTPLGQSAGTIVTRFEMNAETLDGTPVTAFNKFVEFGLYYDDTILAANWLESSLGTFTLDEISQNWEYLPTGVDTVNNLLLFRTNHFSFFESRATGAGTQAFAAPGDGAVLPSAVNAAQSDLFSGAATWAYPLHVPPGRNGLQPALTVSYNSHLVETYQTTHQRSGWLGLGFSLNTGYIELEPSSSREAVQLSQPDAEGNYLYLPSVEAYLTLNGARSRLVRQGDWFPQGQGSNLVAEYRLQQESFMRVQLFRNGSNTSTSFFVPELYPTALNNVYWLVTTKEGTQYRFGAAANAVEIGLADVVKCIGIDCGTFAFKTLNWMSYPRRAYLDRVADLYGNEMFFDYELSPPQTAFLYPSLAPGDELTEGSYQPIDEATFYSYVRLTGIRYTEDSRQVTFEYNEPRFDAESLLSNADVYRLYPSLLSAVQMQVNGDDFLRYEFDYEHLTFYDPFPNQVPVLNTIRMCGEPGQGSGDACEASGYNKLKAETSFDYYSSILGAPVDPRKGRLYQINNGYGGTTTFNYEPLGHNRVIQIATEAPNTEPIIRSFFHDNIVDLDILGKVGKREIWVWNGVKAGFLYETAQTVTRYFFHNPLDSDDNFLPDNPFDNYLSPITGQLDRVEVFNANQVVQIGSNAPLVFGQPIQSTCYEYADALLAQTEQNVFVAPEKVTMVFDDYCVPGHPDGLEVEYHYDDNGNLTEIFERGDPTTAADDRYIKNQFHAGPVVLNRPEVQEIYGRDEDNNFTLLAKTSYNYDPANGQGPLSEVTVTRHSLEDQSNFPNLVTTLRYNSKGNLTETEDAAGNVIETLYASETDVYPSGVKYPPIGNDAPLQSAVTYNPKWGTIATTTGFNGETTTTLYDPFGRIKSIEDPVSKTVYNYNDSGAGLSVDVTYAEGTPDSFHSHQRTNGLGQLAQSETDSAAGPVKVDYEYDRLGRVHKSSIPYTGSTNPNLWSETRYDSLSRPVAVFNPDGTRQGFSYNSWRTRTESFYEDAATEQAERQMTYSLDGFGRVKTVTEQGLSTQYDYDVLGNLIYIKDAANNETTTTYDGLSRVMTQNDPDLGLWQVAYDTRGNLKLQTDARGQIIGFDYDALNRLVAKDYYDDQDAGDGEVTYQYDETGGGNSGRGRRTGMQTDGVGSTTWQYDPPGRLLFETQTFTGLADPYVTGYTYNHLNQIETMTYPDEEVVTYVYHAGGQLQSLTSNDGARYLNGATYNAAGQPTSLFLGGAAAGSGVINYVRHYYTPGENSPTTPVYGLKQIQATAAGSTLLDLANYTYYPDGSLNSFGGQLGNLDPSTVDWSYSYDPQDQLNEATLTIPGSGGGEGGGEGGGPLFSTFDYDYDDISNLTRIFNPVAATEFNLNYTATGRPHAPDTINGWDNSPLADFTYDDNGNRQGDAHQGLNYTYDEENRLRYGSGSVAGSTPDGSLSVTFAYDGAGRRVSRTALLENDNSETTLYIGPHFETKLALTGGWSQPTAIFGASGDYQLAPNMVSDASGTLYLTWVEAVYFESWPQYGYNAQLQFASRDPMTRQWNIENIPSGIHFFQGEPIIPTVIATEPISNQVFVAWQEWDGNNWDIRVYRRGEGGWSRDFEMVRLYNETFPSLAAAPDGAVYLAWQNEDDGTIQVYRRDTAGVWSADHIVPMAGGRPQGFPALAADSQGAIYLAYEYNRFSFSGELKVDRREAGSGLWSNDPTLGDPEFEAGDPPAVAVDSQDNLYVAWGFYEFGLQLGAKKRLANDGSWEDANIFSPQYYGLDIVVDVFDDPQIITGDPIDSSTQHIFVNGNPIYGQPMEEAGYPTLANGPEETLVAIWQAEPVNDDPKRLFIATKGDLTTKYYYAGGQAIAMRSGDELYYLLPDHLGSTTVIANSDGSEAGHVAYDAFGNIIESTLPEGLTDRLFTGQRYDATLGLYDFNARFYDPQLGQFTQPDSLIPQTYNPVALNRFAYVYNSPVNYTDSSGHFIDTLLDAADLAGNIQNCLGDSDALACYMAPVSAGFLAVPFATGGGRGARLLYQADGAGIGGGGQTAYLLGGAGDEIARRQIAELAEKYHRVVVNDAYEGGLEITEILARQEYPGKLDHVDFVLGNAADLPRLNNVDIFVVAPPGHWISGLRWEGMALGKEIPRPRKETLAAVVEDVLGTNSTMWIVTTDAGVDLKRLVAKMQASGFNASFETVERGFKVGPHQVLLDSSFFSGRDFYLATITR